MTVNDTGYAANRQRKRGKRDVMRVIVELPSQLVRDLDDWGTASGMTSRREAMEALLSGVLGGMAAGAEFGDQPPAAETNIKEGQEAIQP